MRPLSPSDARVRYRPALYPTPPVAGRSPHPADDDVLMARVGAGCGQAFAAMVERHGSVPRRVARRVLGDTAEAEDIAQECFVRLWQQAPGWQAHRAGVAGWLYRTARNLCIDRHRRLRHVAGDEPPDRPDEGPLADSLMAANQLSDQVRQALADLPPRHRAALLLCYFEGLSNLAAAQVLDLNLKAMESLLFRARNQLRLRLLAREVGAEDLALLTGDERSAYCAPHQGERG